MARRASTQDDFDLFGDAPKPSRRKRTLAVPGQMGGGPSGPAMQGGPSGPAMSGGPSGPAMSGGPSGPAMAGDKAAAPTRRRKRTAKDVQDLM